MKHEVFPDSPSSLMSDDVFEAISPASAENQEVTPPSKPVDKIRKKKKCNERERYRHRTVNDAFKVLSNVLPAYPVDKRLKKKEILVQSIKYINILKTILQNLDQTLPAQTSTRHSHSDDLTQPDEESINFINETDSHPIILMSGHVPSRSCSWSSDQTSFSTEGSDDLGQLNVTQAGDGVEDWLADMLEAGYCYF